MRRLRGVIWIGAMILAAPAAATQDRLLFAHYMIGTLPNGQEFNELATQILVDRMAPFAEARDYPFARVLYMMRQNNMRICANFLTDDVIQEISAVRIVEQARWSINLVSLDPDAPPFERSHPVLVVNATPQHDAARQAGLLIDPVANPDRALKMIRSGRVNYWVEADMILRQISRRDGMEFKVHRNIKTVTGYLACSRATPASDLNRVRQAWDSTQMADVFDVIFNIFR